MSEIHQFPLKDPAAAERARKYRARKKKARGKRKSVTPPVTPSVTARVMDRVTSTVMPGVMRRDSPAVTPARPTVTARKPGKPRLKPASVALALVAYGIAFALTGTEAWFSIGGLVALYPGAATATVVLGVMLEVGKLGAVAALAHYWSRIVPLGRLALFLLVGIMMVAGGCGAYAALIAAHQGDRPDREAAATGAMAATAARVDAQVAVVTDLDRQVAAIDGVIAEMTRRGRTTGALQAIADQRKTRDALTGQRRREAETLAVLRVDQAVASGRAHVVEAETAPIAVLARMLNVAPDVAIRWLTLVLVLCCDPLGVAIVASMASRRRA